MKKSLLMLALCLAVVALFISCKEEPVEKFTVTFEKDGVVVGTYMMDKEDNILWSKLINAVITIDGQDLTLSKDPRGDMWFSGKRLHLCNSLDSMVYVNSKDAITGDVTVYLY